MLIEVKVPALSESVAEATLLTWHKKAGDYVKRDENLIDIETDKVVLELPSPESGVLKEIVKQDGVSVAANEVIARIDTSVEVADEAVSSVPAPEIVDKKESAAAVVAMPAARK
ncbi:MAG: biotin/lipoyl-containing protein, partial [Betaproteobacteria bacterium]